MLVAAGHLVVEVRARPVGGRAALIYPTIVHVIHALRQSGRVDKRSASTACP